MSTTSDTVERLRADIDSGRTRDKVRASDPAAVPLGADEEAAGTPISSAAVALARQHEVDGPAKTNEDGGVLLYAGLLAGIGIAFVAAAVVFLR